MSSKRRIIRSSSQGEVGLLTHIQPIDPPVARWDKKRVAAKPVQEPKKNSKPANVKPEPPQKCIFTVGSPVKDTIGDESEMKVDERFGVFFKTCFSCKKEITEEDHVYMYGYLRAFCSPDCREGQIYRDGKKNRAYFEAMEAEIEFLAERWGEAIHKLSS